MEHVWCRKCGYSWIIIHGRIWGDTRPLCRHVDMPEEMRCNLLKETRPGAGNAGGKAGSDS